MTPQSIPLGTAIRGGLIEARLALTNASDLFSMLFWPVITIVVMVFLRGSTLPGTDFSLGAAGVPGVLALQVLFTGFFGVGAYLVLEREDGTLLRAKAVPNGVLGHLISKIVAAMISAFITIALVLVAALLLFEDLTVSGQGLFTLLLVLVLGMVATMSTGAVVGSLTDNPRNISLLFIPIVGLVAISGIFYPLTALPEWLQVIGQFFPLYWIGLGMRSALLPDAAVAVEIGDSWRQLETAGVLGLWAIAGLVLAPILLRRMARRESGAQLPRRRERALARIQ